MKRTSATLPVLLLFALASSSLALAQPASSATVRAGGLSFVFPSPSKDLVEPGPDYRVVLEPLAPTANRLVAAFVTPDVVPVLQTGGRPPLHEYALVEASRPAEFANVTPELFNQIRLELSKQLNGDLTGTTQEQQAEVNRRLKALGSANAISIQTPVMIGTLFSSEDAIGFGLVVPITVKDQSLKLAASTIAVRVKDRVFFAYLYTEYKDESSIDWLRTTGQQWALAILKANP